MTTAVVWFEIYVDDMARAKRFYEQLFGVTLNKLTHDNMHEGMDYWAFPGGDQNTYGSNGALVKMPGLKAGGGASIVYFHTEDCGKAAAKAAELGGKLCQDKTKIGEHGFIALLTDTEGNMIGLHSMG
jgi:uncharacterized protein